VSPECSQDETSRSKRKFEAARMEGRQPGADAQATTTTRGHFEEEIFLNFSSFFHFFEKVFWIENFIRRPSNVK